MISNQRINELEKKRMFSEVERLKDQINPSSFFKTLNKTGMLVKTEPDKASGMLMKLSQLLRYQLYDCNREKVMLKSEITFLRNYLELESMYSPDFHYKIKENIISNVFIAPSILLPYVQSVVNIISHEKGNLDLDIYISNEDKFIKIEIRVSGLYEEKLVGSELAKVKIRLDTLYKNHYKLELVGNTASSSTVISLILDKE